MITKNKKKINILIFKYSYDIKRINLGLKKIYIEKFKNESFY